MISLFLNCSSWSIRDTVPFLKEFNVPTLCIYGTGETDFEYLRPESSSGFPQKFVLSPSIRFSLSWLERLNSLPDLTWVITTDSRERADEYGVTNLREDSISVDLMGLSPSIEWQLPKLSSGISPSSKVVERWSTSESFLQKIHPVFYTIPVTQRADIQRRVIDFIAGPSKDHWRTSGFPRVDSLIQSKEAKLLRQACRLFVKTRNRTEVASTFPGVLMSDVLYFTSRFVKNAQ